ncbi:MAG: methyltransferase [Chloroflexota bacterium]
MFQFKQFVIHQGQAAFKVGTDGILLGASANHPACQTILDIGTGTGLLALMLAQKYSVATVDAVEIDSAAAQQARENVKNSPFSNQINVFEGDIVHFAEKSNPKYNLIVCNPPFFNKRDGTLSPAFPKSQARHTVSLSFTQLLQAVGLLLAENGRFFSIIPCQQFEPFNKVLIVKPLFVTQKTLIQPKPSKPAHRLLLQIEKNEKQMTRLSMCIETNRRHVYSRAYYDLTQEYYLNLAHA